MTNTLYCHSLSILFYSFYGKNYKEVTHIKVLHLKDLEDKCVYEFAEGRFNKEHWKESSIYVTFEDFNKLSPFIEEIMPEFNYYGPNTVSIFQWNKLKEKIIIKFRQEKLDNINLLDPFNEIDIWVQDCFKNHGHFSILGP
ncbi:hypothetical protein [Cytobacillus sp. IB215665]|uniref:hypothetical protein n=1 Tax=Cytobacillus sp. IB215665 TaxID=3097357 RepID=UPI002A16F2B4|nr:hypothetical protein [Cytobacillus sp. IB215665]MDX8363934.1 hypothetical protein [Cytobacillus sp. IB215665]